MKSNTENTAPYTNDAETKSEVLFCSLNISFNIFHANKNALSIFSVYSQSNQTHMYLYKNMWDAVCFLSVSSHLKFRSLWMTATVLARADCTEIEVLFGAHSCTLLLSFSRLVSHKVDYFLR